jgi:hypothetical protein
MAQTLLETPTPDIQQWAAYADDPVGFGEALGEHFTDDVKRMMESVRDYPVTIAKSANATGKTFSAARVAAWFYKAFGDAQVYCAAAPPEDNLRRLLWAQIESVVTRHPALFDKSKVRDLQLSRSPQSFIAGVTIPTSGTPEQREARFSGKHAPHLLFIVDEGDAVPDEVYRGIESCMSGGFARLLIMFNPRAESGTVYRMEREGRAHVVRLSALDHPNVVTGADVIPGAVTRETTVRRIHNWSRPLVPGEKPDHECFELPDFLAGAQATGFDGQLLPPLAAGWRRITDPALSYMVLGEYPAQSAYQLINRTWVDAARARWDAYAAQHGQRPPVGTAPIMGLDVAEFGADSNAAVFRYGGWVSLFETWGGVDIYQTGERAAVLYQERGAQAAQVDATGVGAGVAPHMVRKGCKRVNPVRVAVSPTQTTEQGEFALLRDQLWWAVREWLRTDSGAMLPPDRDLTQELTTPTYSVKDGKIRIMSKDVMKELLKRSPDKADALCLTFAPASRGAVGKVF